VLVGFIEEVEASRAVKISASERRVEALAAFAPTSAHRPVNRSSMLKIGATICFATGYGGYWPTGVWTGYGESLCAPIGRLQQPELNLPPLG
jgi:hypothetical protein